ncbi:MAG: capsule assembly Wzi family protein [Bacteroidetes bacterium]|nr:capsule assembly Wzi family protein [Bacteroidota bacterium]
MFVADNGEQDAPAGESHNKLGNHLGTRNFGLDYRFKKLTVKLYWQNIFEDGSGLAYRNIKDGLWGISIKLNKEALIRSLNFEYIHTTDQSGPIDMVKIDGVWQFFGGNDNYFNNYLYTNGWAYKEMTLGTPLFTSPAS